MHCPGTAGQGAGQIGTRHDPEIGIVRRQIASPKAKVEDQKTCQQDTEQGKGPEIHPEGLLEGCESGQITPPGGPGSVRNCPIGYCPARLHTLFA